MMSFTRQSEQMQRGFLQSFIGDIAPHVLNSYLVSDNTQMLNTYPCIYPNLRYLGYRSNRHGIQTCPEEQGKNFPKTPVESTS